MAYKLYDKKGREGPYPAGVTVSKGGANFTKSGMALLGFQVGSRYDIYIDEASGLIGFDHKAIGGLMRVSAGSTQKSLARACQELKFAPGFYPLMKVDKLPVMFEIRRPEK